MARETTKISINVATHNKFLQLKKLKREEGNFDTTIISLTEKALNSYADKELKKYGR